MGRLQQIAIQAVVKAIVGAWPILEPMLLDVLRGLAVHVLQAAKAQQFPEGWKLLEQPIDDAADKILAAIGATTAG